MDIQKEEADKYQGLFNLMSKEHNLTLTISEMDEIIREAQKIVTGNCDHKQVHLVQHACKCIKCGKVMDFQW
jgi:hypothetical protein